METRSTCIEKDEKLKSRDIEFTKIEKVFKDKCKEMFENENILKQKEEKLTQKCNVLQKENEILKQKCSAKREKCLQKENVVKKMKKQYDAIKYSQHRTKEAYETLKSQVKRLQKKAMKYSETT
ncbi:hypothetical protein Hanom_Chr17g01581901 [Helianthus anomalus]